MGRSRGIMEEMGKASKVHSGREKGRDRHMNKYRKM
jgi:hypothetical protein